MENAGFYLILKCKDLSFYEIELKGFIFSGNSLPPYEILISLRLNFGVVYHKVEGVSNLGTFPMV